MKFEVKEIKETGKMAEFFGPSYLFRFVFGHDIIQAGANDTEIYERTITAMKNEVSEYCRQHFETVYCMSEESVQFDFAGTEIVAYFSLTWNPFMGESFKENIRTIKKRLAKYRKDLKELVKFGWGYSDDAQECRYGIESCEYWLQRNKLM